MATIDQLNAQDILTVSDLIAIYSASNGDARKSSLYNLALFLQTIITVTDSKQTQYAAPNASGFNVLISGITGQSIWLILTPVADYAVGTITLPVSTTCIDKQEVLINTTHAITVLTVAGNGATVVGAPTTLAINGIIRLRFDLVTQTWYKV